MSPEELEAWSAPRRSTLRHRLLEAIADIEPPAFRSACAYPLETGGKRIRPLLALAVAGHLGAEERAWPAAVAVELVHTYSLVHDDLPCMDDDDLRRGRPTVHRRFDEATAVLVGDALLTRAFEHLAGAPGLDPATRLAQVAELGRAAGARGMIAGQARDIGLGGPLTDPASLERLHREKTGALIACACRLGALAAGASAEVLATLGRYGEALGLAFQLADDILDADEDAGEEGPPSFVHLLGADATRSRALEQSHLARESSLGSPLLAALARFAVERTH